MLAEFCALTLSLAGVHSTGWVDDPALRAREEVVCVKGDYSFFISHNDQLNDSDFHRDTTTVGFLKQLQFEGLYVIGRFWHEDYNASGWDYQFSSSGGLGIHKPLGNWGIHLEGGGGVAHWKGFNEPLGYNPMIWGYLELSDPINSSTDLSFFAYVEYDTKYEEQSSGGGTHLRVSYCDKKCFVKTSFSVAYSPTSPNNITVDTQALIEMGITIK